jgi:hypothetical protein
LILLNLCGSILFFGFVLRLVSYLCSGASRFYLAPGIVRRGQRARFFWRSIFRLLCGSPVVIFNFTQRASQFLLLALRSQRQQSSRSVFRSPARDLPVRAGSVSRFPVALRFPRLCSLAQLRPEFFCSCCGFCANKGHRPIFISCSRPLLALAPRSAAVPCLPLNLGFCSQFLSPYSCSFSWLGSAPGIPAAKVRVLPKFLADSPVLVFFCWPRFSSPIRVSKRRFSRQFFICLIRSLLASGFSSSISVLPFSYPVSCWNRPCCPPGTAASLLTVLVFIFASIVVAVPDWLL